MNKTNLTIEYDPDVDPHMTMFKDEQYCPEKVTDEWVTQMVENDISLLCTALVAVIHSAEQSLGANGGKLMEAAISDIGAMFANPTGEGEVTVAKKIAK